MCSSNATYWSITLFCNISFCAVDVWHPVHQLLRKSCICTAGDPATVNIASVLQLSLKFCICAAVGTGTANCLCTASCCCYCMSNEKTSQITELTVFSMIPCECWNMTAASLCVLKLSEILLPCCCWHCHCQLLLLLHEQRKNIPNYWTNYVQYDTMWMLEHDRC